MKRLDASPVGILDLSVPQRNVDWNRVSVSLFVSERNADWGCAILCRAADGLSDLWLGCTCEDVSSECGHVVLLGVRLCACACVSVSERCSVRAEAQNEYLRNQSCLCFAGTGEARGDYT